MEKPIGTVFNQKFSPILSAAFIDSLATRLGSAYNESKGFICWDFISIALVQVHRFQSAKGELSMKLTRAEFLNKIQACWLGKKPERIPVGFLSGSCALCVYLLVKSR